MGIAGLAPDSVAYAVVVFAAVATAGLALGSVRIAGVKLGIAGVLFAGLFVGRAGFVPDGHFLEFFREFGLILFVYTIGLQLGPGFFSAFKREGLRLNFLAAVVAVAGFGVAAASAVFFGLDRAAAIGVFSGATTNTPSLAASQEMMRASGAAAEALGAATAGYAVAYPFGVIGIILVMIGMRAAFRVDVQREAADFDRSGPVIERLEVTNMRVTNPNLFGLPLKKIPALSSSGVVSRVWSAGRVSAARPDTVLHEGDVLLVVGPPKRLDELLLVVGEKSDMDIRAHSSGLSSRRIVVTRKKVLGRTLSELNLPGRYGVNVTRVIRSEFELSALPSLRMQYGDVLVTVGEEAAIVEAAKEFGNSPKSLVQPQLIPLFLGIGAGVVLGNVPISLPGLPVPVRLGYAGGPLIAAILLANLGRIGSIVWYMRQSANFALREMGIVMFLASVGLRSGERFFSAIATGEGLAWMAAGAAVTAIPLLLAALVARVWMRMNYLTACGLLAGSMTDPPALAFADQITNSNAPAVSYASVYPLTMLLRIVLAQALVLLIFR